MKKWILNVLIGFDEWWNAILGGDPQETISSRAGRALTQNRRWARILCGVLDKLEKDHCKQAAKNYPVHLATNDEVLNLENGNGASNTHGITSSPGGVDVSSAQASSSSGHLGTNFDSPQAP